MLAGFEHSGDHGLPVHFDDARTEFGTQGVGQCDLAARREAQGGIDVTCHRFGKREPGADRDAVSLSKILTDLVPYGSRRCDGSQ